MTTIHGMTALRSKLARLTVESDDIAEAATEKIAEGIADDARSFVPVETGRLRESIESTPNSVHTDVDYAEFVEFGTVNMPAQPFMRPAADDAERHVPEAVVTAALEVRKRT